MDLESFTDVMESNSFIITNDRTLSDANGQYTYITLVGKSPPDLIWLAHAMKASLKDPVRTCKRSGFS